MSSDLATIAAVPYQETGHYDTTGLQAFGFWIYLMSDLVLFAAIFATFAVVGRNYAGGPGGRELFDLPYLFAETMLLLVSSATYGLAMLAVAGERHRLVILGLAVTFALGLGFLAMEVHEFYGMILAGNGPQRSASLSAFFTLVGTHGTHVLFGLIWIAVMIGQVIGKGLTNPVRSRLLLLGMFWHFLDIIWVGVFTVVYLQGVL